MLYTCVSPPDFGQLPEHDDAVIAAAACQVFGAKETDSKILFATSSVSDATLHDAADILQSGI